MPALLIIDMQNDFVLPGRPVTVTGALATVPNIRRLLDAFRARGWPVLHLTRAYRADGSDVEQFRREAFLRGPQYLLPGTPGAEIVEELQPRPGEHVLVKPRFSAFLGTPLDLLLRRLGVQQPSEQPSHIERRRVQAVSVCVSLMQQISQPQLVGECPPLGGVFQHGFGLWRFLRPDQ